ncbi:hypothetical protein FOQG_19275 [Fusarium oxysporum f. sp. raphani 54005]|uniref:Uncharacterized protein n=1 Tax=Fusarium oxysporum f. sp. raphani 54005 TaxID=1089458 RepID=X0BAW3_FUSOX|nr:hypothetical protein FOQG_19275 [Fusarium oxysporum f. sp. raphani 54005]
MSFVAFLNCAYRTKRLPRFKVYHGAHGANQGTSTAIYRRSPGLPSSSCSTSCASRSRMTKTESPICWIKCARSTFSRWRRHLSDMYCNGGYISLRPPAPVLPSTKPAGPLMGKRSTIWGRNYTWNK